MSGIASERDFKERYYGLSTGYNDPAANPYSQAALLMHQHEVGERGTLNSAGNQLYAGSTVNAEHAVTRHYDEGLSGLKEQQAADQARWTREEQEAQHEKEEREERAEQEAIEREEEREPDPAPVAADSGGGGGGGGGSGGSTPLGKFFGANNAGKRRVKRK